MTGLSEIAGAYDVVVVGAGPAGLAAAKRTAGAGLSTLVVDEGPSPGGQVWRAVTTTPLQSRPLLGEDYWAGAEAVRGLAQSGATYLAETTVWSLEDDGTVGLSAGGVARLVEARYVIVATGAMERPFPVPGWTLPGVMTVGGAQGLLKASGLYPSGPLVIAGCGPLIWLYAAQLLRAGGHIAAILDTTEASAWRRALPHAGRFVMSAYLTRGVALIAEVRRRVRVIGGITHLALEGTDRVRAAVYRGGGRDGRLAAATVLLHQGVVPQVNLAMAAGVRHRWDTGQACFVPIVDAAGRTGISRIAIAGDSAGIAGWEAALERGELAALGAIEALAPGSVDARGMAAIRKRLERRSEARAFLDAYYQPAPTFRIPTGKTVVCRCEEVPACDVERAVELGCLGPSQLKSFTRCGMGPCQGRMCGLTVTEIIAARRRLSPADIGYFRLRPPVKPITLAQLASLPASEAAAGAVTGRRR